MDDLNRQEHVTSFGPTKQGEETSPAFQFSVLTCAGRGQLATKIIYADGKEVPFSYVKYFHYAYREIDSLEDFAKLVLPWLADEPKRFIIRGQLLPGLSGRQRRLIYPKDDDPATIVCPPRRWIPIDLDGVRVPAGLGSPDKLAEAAYHIRDNMLPSYFRGVRCVATASASTGRKGPCIARLRLFFVLNEAVENERLRLWITGLSEKFIAIDPSVMLAHQPIYTARPIFFDCADPVPVWGRVRLLDGHEDVLVPDLPRKSATKKYVSDNFKPAMRVCNDAPNWLLKDGEADAGCGVASVDAISDKAWGAIKYIFQALDGCPKPGGIKLGADYGRHSTLNTAAWWLARLYAEGEIPEKEAREAYWDAVKGISNGDGKYDSKLLARHIDDAFNDVCRRADTVATGRQP